MHSSGMVDELSTSVATLCWAQSSKAIWCLVTDTPSCMAIVMSWNCLQIFQMLLDLTAYAVWPEQEYTTPTVCLSLIIHNYHTICQ